MCRIIHTIYTTCFHTTTISHPCFGLKSIISSRHVYFHPSSTLYQHENTISKPTNKNHESIILHMLCPSCTSIWKSYGVSKTEAENRVEAWRKRHGEDGREKVMPVLAEDGRVCVRLDHSQDHITESSERLANVDEREDGKINFWTNSRLGPGSGLDVEARYLDELGFNAPSMLTVEPILKSDKSLNCPSTATSTCSSPKQGSTVLSSEVRDFEFLVDENESR